MSKPIAILISDCHYSLNTLELADTAFRAAIDKAAELGVPLIDCGDLTNDKAILRGEVVNRLIETMLYARSRSVKVFMLVGNHSLVNEKGSEHVLNFLAPYATIVHRPTFSAVLGLELIPYQSDTLNIDSYLTCCQKNSVLIMHQGFLGAQMGDYVQDKTSISPEIVKDFKVFSGHYHRHQDIGTVTYVGNPYTLSFGEALDGPKGFLILNEDGSYTREILNLRRHYKIELSCYGIEFWDLPSMAPAPEDLTWVKLKGTHSELAKINKTELGERLLGHSNYKLDKIYTDSPKLESETTHLSGEEILDKLIDNTNEGLGVKVELKKLWREIV